VIQRGPVVIVFNLSEDDQAVPHEGGPAIEMILASNERIQAEREVLEMPGESVAVVRIGG
jgi:hypothetical protein